MNLGDAWHDPIFRIYLIVVAAVLIGAGAILAILHRVLKKDVSSILLTYRSWLIMAPLVVLAILLGRIAVVIFFVLVALIGFKEYARATGLYRDWWMTGTAYAAILAVAYTALAPNPHDHRNGWYGFFMAMPVYAITAFGLVPILRNRVAGQLQIMALAIVGFVYIGWMFLHLAFMADRPATFDYLFFLLFAVELNDVAAFTIGRLFGKPGRHALRSAISPKKTWEGAIGAFAVSMILPWAMWFSFPHFGPLQLILSGLIVGVGGQLGDLSMSMIKRDVGIKDMGSSIPGHGGILDRIDSLIYTAPLFFHMVNYFYGPW